MDVPVMSYETHDDLTGTEQFINALSTFATSCGWTVIEKQNNMKWILIGGGVYGWSADTQLAPEQFWMAENTAGLQMRVRVWSHDTAGREIQKVQLFCFPASSTYSTASSTHPTLQAGKLISTANSGFLCMGLHYKVWFFGNSETLYWEIAYDTDFALGCVMGRFQVYDTASADYALLGVNETSSTSYWTIAAVKAGGSASHWVRNTNTQTVWYYKRALTWGVSGATGMHNSFRSAGSYSDILGDYAQGFLISPLPVIQNLHSAHIPLWRHSITIKDVDNAWFLAGYYHCVDLQYMQGGEIGMPLEYDSATYLCFPLKNRWTDYAWHAFRIG